MEGLDSSFIGGVRIRHAGVLTNEVFHGQHTAHPAGVITKEDTAKGSKGTDQVGSYGDGGFEARRVRRACNDKGGYSSSRHDGGDIDWEYLKAVECREVRCRRERERERERVRKRK